MEISSESGPGTSRRRAWNDPRDLEKKEGWKHSKLEDSVSQDSVGEEYLGKGLEEEGKEEGEGSTEWGDRTEEEGKEMITESGEWAEVVSRRVKGGGARRGQYKNGDGKKNMRVKWKGKN